MLRNSTGRVSGPGNARSRLRIVLVVALMGLGLAASLVGECPDAHPELLQRARFLASHARRRQQLLGRVHGAYKINYIKLPTSADLQRQQLVRRLAAHDSSLDIMGLDVTWEAEFARGRLDHPLDRRHRPAGRVQHLARPPQHGPVAGKAGGGAAELQHRAALVPVRPGAQSAEDLGRDDLRRRAAGQAR